ncbi:hypothetical protein JCM15519_22810 [Fundidesulfovibrio butyratiphilus]
MAPSVPDDAHDLDRLDQLDALLARFRPIEHLFQVMGAVGDTGDGAELVRGCSEIGLNLTGQFRDELERVFGRGDGGGGRAERLE